MAEIKTPKLNGANITVGGKTIKAGGVRPTQAAQIPSATKTATVGGMPSGGTTGHTQGTSSLPLTSPSSMQGFKTGTSIERASAERVHTSTEGYQSTRATTYSAPVTQVDRGPRIVEAVKTPMTGKIAPPTAASTQQPSFRQSTSGEAEQTPMVNTYSPPSRVMVNGVTGTLLTTAQRMRVANQTAAGQFQVSRMTTTASNITGTQVKAALNKMSGMQIGYSGVGTVGAFEKFMQSPTGLKNNLFGVGKTALTSTAGKVQEASDLGTESVGQAVALGQTAYLSFKVSQKITDVAPGVIMKVGSSTAKATYEVATTTGRATLTLAKTVDGIAASYAHGIAGMGGVVGAFSVPKQYFSILQQNALATGLNKTAISQGIIHSVEKLSTGYHTVAGAIKTGIHTAGAVTGKTVRVLHEAQKTFTIVRGVATGQIATSVMRQAAVTQLRQMGRTIKTGALTGVKTGGRAVLRGAVKGGGVLVKNAPAGLFKVAKGGKFAVRNISLAGAGILTASDNTALQGVGHAINFGHLGIKTGVTGFRIAGKGVGYSIKTAGKVKTGYAFIKNNGLKKAFAKARNSVAQKFVGAGKSAVSAMINIVKMAGRKLVIPLLLLVVAIAGFDTIIMVPVNAVGAIFSGLFSFSDGATGEDVDVEEYISTYISALLAEDKQETVDELSAAMENPNVDVVRFQSDLTGQDAYLGQNLAAMESAFPSDEQITKVLQPIFNAVVLMDYDLTPSQAEAENLLAYMYDKLFSLDTKETTEFCGQDLATGEGEPDEPCSECGHIHAHSDCPHITTGTHSSYTCSSCCYYYCPGHEHTDEEGGTYTTYCPNGCTHACAGYSYCDEGHAVKTLTLAVDGVWALVDEYFQGPINELSAIPEANRTDEEKEKLQNLKDYLEIFWEMVNQLSENYGWNIAGNLTPDILNGLEFETGTRRGNQDVINVAIAQVGQQGGRPFWTYYGFDERVEWCACFVHWCMRHTPSASPYYPTTANNAGVGTVKDWFVEQGQFVDGNYTDLAAGDCVFFDWEPDGRPNHIGLVIGRVGDTIYTVEGNSGDAVRINTYSVGSNVLYGYGLMKWN